MFDFLFFFLRFIYLFIYDGHRERERERGRDTGRGRSRLHAGSPMWDSILGLDPRTPGPCRRPKAGDRPLRDPQKYIFLKWMYVSGVVLTISVWYCLSDKLNEHFCLDWQIVWFHGRVPQPLSMVPSCLGVKYTLALKLSATIHVVWKTWGRKVIQES